MTEVIKIDTVQKSGIRSEFIHIYVNFKEAVTSLISFYNSILNRLADKTAAQLDRIAN